MWALRFNGVLKVEKASFNADKPCFLCNNFLRKGDEIVFIIIPYKYRGTHKNLMNNFYCHKDEWLEFSKDCKDYDEMAERIKHIKRKKRSLMTAEDEFKIKMFEKAVNSFGFTEIIKKPFGLKAKMPKSSVNVVYNVYLDQFKVDYNKKAGMFSVFFEKEMSSKILNKMNELMGIDERVVEESAIDSISNVIKNTIDTINNNK